MYALAGTLRGTHLASSCLNPRPHFQSLPLVSITVYGYLNALTLVWDEPLPDAAMQRDTDAQTNCAAVCFETHGDSSFHGPCRWLVRENSRSAGCNYRTLRATASSVRPLPHRRRERERRHAAFPRHQYGNRSSRAVHYRQTKRALSVPSCFAATPFPAVRRPIAGHSGEVRMTSLRRLAFVGNSLPRRCGIATFTTDLQQSISKSRVGVETAIVAMTDHGHAYEYPPAVRLQINDAKLDEYDRAAEFLNAEQFELVCLQHEFGIFGGDAGSHILALLARLTMPIVSTLHTILAEPRPVQRDVLSGIIDVSSKVIVMAEKARELLRNVYSVPAEKIEVIPHGIPNAPFVEPDAAKRRLGFSRKPVILTFGLLSPNKGIEVMIDAMRSILKSRADAVYVVLGATHPNLIRREGEAYRESLTARVRALGVEEHVVFLNQFVDLTTLLDYISMCDIYVTPYMNEAQMTSGTLAYSFGLGKAVVSTPYWHARELLADGRGILVPFGDPKSVGAEIA